MTKLVSVKFQNENSGYRAGFKTYSYLFEGDTPVEKDDMAVVLSPYGGYQVVFVVEVRDAADSEKDLKKILGVLSFAEERARKAREAEKAKITKQLEKLVKEEAKLVTFERVAASNPEAKALLEQLAKLG